MLAQSPTPSREDELLGRIAALEDEIAYLKSELGLSQAAHPRLMLQHVFALAPQESWLLNTLYQAHGRVLNREFLAENVPGFHDERDPQLINVLVSKLRRKLGRERSYIRYLHGYRGYQLSADGMALCAYALACEERPT